MVLTSMMLYLIFPSKTYSNCSKRKTRILVYETINLYITISWRLNTTAQKRNHTYLNVLRLKTKILCLLLTFVLTEMRELSPDYIKDDFVTINVKSSATPTVILLIYTILLHHWVHHNELLLVLKIFFFIRHSWIIILESALK